MKERLCSGCLLPAYECVCDDHVIEKDPLKLKLKRLGIKDPKGLVAACIAHGTGRLRRAEQHTESWYSKK